MEYGIPFLLETYRGNLEFNTPTSPFILQKADGLDGAALRLRTDDAAGREGMIIFPSKRGGQFPTLSGLIAGGSPSADHEASDLLRGYTDSMRDLWGTLSWTHSNGSQRWIQVVLADRLTIQGQRPPEFFLPMACPTSMKFGFTRHTDTVIAGASNLFGTAVVLHNGGDTAVWPRVRLHGGAGGTYFWLYNNTTGAVLGLSGAIASTHYIDLDFLNDTMYYDGDLAQTRLGMLDIGDWWPLIPGDNEIQVVATWGNTGTAPSAEFFWFDGWV